MGISPTGTTSPASGSDHQLSPPLISLGFLISTGMTNRRCKTPLKVGAIIRAEQVVSLPARKRRAGDFYLPSLTRRGAASFRITHIYMHTIGSDKLPLSLYNWQPLKEHAVLSNFQKLDCR
ncbi:hypothetical protein ACER0C_019852 [Sarotherodon galilaeus]